MIIAKLDNLKKIPKNCYECPYGQSGEVLVHRTGKSFEFDYKCVLNQRGMCNSKRNKECPLKEVKEE